MVSAGRIGDNRTERSSDLNDAGAVLRKSCDDKLGADGETRTRTAFATTPSR
jgi:hypothetical protein